MAAIHKNKVREPLEDRIFAWVSYVLLTLLALICLYPLYFVVIASFSDPDAVYNGDVMMWVKGFTTMGYEKILQNDMLFRGFFNSVFYTVVGTLINLAVTLPAAYALSRRDLIGRRPIMILFLITNTRSSVAG